MPGSRLCRTAILLALLLTPGIVTAAAEESPPSLFLRTAIALREAEPDLAARFATEALGELYTVYSAEADLARRQIAAAAPAGKLHSWSAAVDRYASQVLLLLDDLAQGFPVHIGTRRNSVVVVTVADRSIMLTHPRVGQQLPYEARVLDAFCAEADCAMLVVEDRTPVYEPEYVGYIRPEWRFGEGGASCHHEGVSLSFAPADGLPQLRVLCRRFFEESNDLLSELAWQQVLETGIDWPSLAIRATPGGTQHFIVLNASGDTVLSELPLLYANPGVLSRLIPWLERRLAGDEEAELVLDGAAISDIPP